MKSARYPRVAVLLGVRKRWFIPLLLCRSLAISFAIWWGCIMSLNVWELGKSAWNGGMEVEVEVGAGSDGRFTFRLVVAQLALAYLWAITSAYLAHLFAASLMSRWLQYYSPLAVLVRLCSLSIILSYALTQIFIYTDTVTINTDLSISQNLSRLSGSLPVWICVAVGFLLVYFSTQQDISIESDRDDRRRRLVLRVKCLVALAGTSLVSLVVLLGVVRLGDREVMESLEGVVLRAENLVHWVRMVLESSKGEL